MHLKHKLLLLRAASLAIARCPAQQKNHALALGPDQSAKSLKSAVQRSLLLYSPFAGPLQPTAFTLTAKAPSLIRSSGRHIRRARAL